MRPIGDLRKHLHRRRDRKLAQTCATRISISKSPVHTESASLQAFLPPSRGAGWTFVTRAEDRVSMSEVAVPKKSMRVVAMRGHGDRWPINYKKVNFVAAYLCKIECMSAWTMRGASREGYCSGNTLSHFYPGWLDRITRRAWLQPEAPPVGNEPPPHRRGVLACGTSETRIHDRVNTVFEDPSFSAALQCGPRVRPGMHRAPIPCRLAALIEMQQVGTYCSPVTLKEREESELMATNVDRHVRARQISRR